MYVYNRFCSSSWADFITSINQTGKYLSTHLYAFCLLQIWEILFRHIRTSTGKGKMRTTEKSSAYNKHYAVTKHIWGELITILFLLYFLNIAYNNNLIDFVYAFLICFKSVFYCGKMFAVWIKITLRFWADLSIFVQMNVCSLI